MNKKPCKTFKQAFKNPLEINTLMIKDKNIKEVPDEIADLVYLESLYWQNINFQSFNLPLLENLRHLSISGDSLQSIGRSIFHLPQLASTC